MGTILITGGAVRIGREIALSLLKKKYKVIIHYNTSHKEALNLKKLHLEIEIIKCDFNDINQVAQLLDSIDNLDAIINNASTFQMDNITNISPIGFNAHFNVNTLAPILLSQCFIEKFKKGDIINILDTWAQDLPDNFLSYTLSKNALRDFTLMASQTAPKSIRINGISLGFTLYKPGSSKQLFEQNQKKYPSTPELVCQMIDFVLSEKMNGKIIDLTKHHVADKLAQPSNSVNS